MKQSTELSLKNFDRKVKVFRKLTQIIKFQNIKNKQKIIKLKNMNSKNPITKVVEFFCKFF